MRVLPPELRAALDEIVTIKLQVTNLRVDKHNSFHSVSIPNLPARRFGVLGRVFITHNGEVDSHSSLVQLRHTRLNIGITLLGDADGFPRDGFATKEEAQAWCDKNRKMLSDGIDREVKVDWLRCNAPSLSIAKAVYIEPLF